MDLWLQDFHGIGPQNAQICDDKSPSAPPIVGTSVGINHAAERTFRVTEHGTPGIIEWNSSTTKNDPNATKGVSSGTFSEDHTGNRVPDTSLRFICLDMHCYSSTSVTLLSSFLMLLSAQVCPWG